MLVARGVLPLLKQPRDSFLSISPELCSLWTALCLPATSTNDHHCPCSVVNVELRHPVSRTCAVPFLPCA
ncbi:unnamed protein product, partial [Closterium sp. Naga37s-1]